MGVGSIAVSATQLCVPGADEARHQQVFEAAMAPLLALQRERQADSTDGHWCFALPDKSAYRPKALFGLLRCFDGALLQLRGLPCLCFSYAAWGLLCWAAVLRCACRLRSPSPLMQPHPPAFPHAQPTPSEKWATIWRLQRQRPLGCRRGRRGQRAQVPACRGAGGAGIEAAAALHLIVGLLHA